MEIKEFQVSRWSHLVNVPFSICWSEDDNVAMVTDKGICVTCLNLSPLNKLPYLKMKRYLIDPSKEVPTMDCGVNSVELLKKLNRETLTQIVQDFTMFPMVRADSYIPSVKQVGWAPLIQKNSYGSLLTILNDSGFLEIKRLEMSSWVDYGSVTEQWLKYWKSNWSEISLLNISEQEAIDTLRQRTYIIKITAFIWGVAWECWSTLFTTNMVGQVAIWKVQWHSNREERIHLMHVIDTYIGHLTAVFHQTTDYNKSLILVGSLEGQIHSIPIEYSDGVFAVSDSRLIWSDKDKIQLVPNGATSLIWNDSVVFVLSKGCHLVVFQLDKLGQQTRTVTCNVDDVACTGLANISQHEIMYSTRNGSVSILKLGKESQEINPSSRFIHTSLRTLHYACQGFSLSKSKVVAVFAYSVCKLYDHLALREPSQQIWCTFSTTLTAEAFLQKTSTSLNNIWDALEIERLNSITSVKEIDVPSRKELDVMETTELKKMMWLTHIYVNCQGQKEGTHVALHEEMILLVVSCHIFKRLTNFHGPMNDFNKKSRSLMKTWLEQILVSLSDEYESTKSTAKTILNQLQETKMEYYEELCAVCGSRTLNSLDYFRATCELGHRVPRCSLSLVQCDSLPYYNCMRCGLIALLEPVEDCDICVLCDGKLVLNEYIS